MSQKPSPTFAEGPSSFLQSLTSKIHGNGGSGRNSVAEVQRIRSELSNQVQAVSNKQEMQMRQIDSQLSMLQQELKPKLQNIERQQGFTQKQLEELRQRVQRLATEELASLQHKYDQMGVKFDRFMRVEVEDEANARRSEAVSFKIRRIECHNQLQLQEDQRKPERPQREIERNNRKFEISTREI